MSSPAAAPRAIDATRVLHRQLQRGLPSAVSAHGMTITDADGRAYLDACGGAAVSCLGHGHPEVLAAMHAQIDRVAYAHTSFFTTEVGEQLADQLVRTAPAGMSHAYFVSGGSEAMEAALKMARQYFVEIGQPGRRHFIARRQSYHGNTLGALAVGGNEWRRRQFAPLLIEVTHVSPCYEYRGREKSDATNFEKSGYFGDHFDQGVTGNIHQKRYENQSDRKHRDQPVSPLEVEETECVSCECSGNETLVDDHRKRHQKSGGPGDC